MGIYSVAANGDLTLVASTPNDTTLFAATFTSYSKALSAALNKVAGQRYALGLIVVTAAAIPSFIGWAGVNASIFQATMLQSPTLAARMNGQVNLPANIPVGSLTGGNTGRIGFVLS